MEPCPEKFSYKATTTGKLRNDIRREAGRYREPVYLEIGVDRAYTLLEVCSAFTACVGVENDPERFELAAENIERQGLQERVQLIEGTSSDIDCGEYHVVFIDAGHDYASVLADFEAVRERNTAPRFTVFFHDYGLVGAGVKKLVDQTFLESSVRWAGEKEGWNPLGAPVNGCECAFVRLVGTRSRCATVI